MNGVLSGLCVVQAKAWNDLFSNGIGGNGAWLEEDGYAKSTIEKW